MEEDAAIAEADSILAELEAGVDARGANAEPSAAYQTQRSHAPPSSVDARHRLSKRQSKHATHSESNKQSTLRSGNHVDNEESKHTRARLQRKRHELAPEIETLHSAESARRNAESEAVQQLRRSVMRSRNQIASTKRTSGASTLHSLAPDGTYEDERRREKEEQHERKRTQIAQRSAQRANETIAKLLQEEEEEQKRERERKEHERYMEQRVRNQARLRERELDRYMRNATADGVTILDPTGHSTIFPSKVSTAIPKSFGIGSADEHTLKRELSRFPDTEPLGSLVNPSTNEVVEQRELSKHEKDLMEAAKARHRETLTQSQYVCGKSFEGGGFLPQPAVISFQDFVAGEEYSQNLHLTNRSLSFNSFRIIGFPEEVQHLLRVEWQSLPGRVAAGISSNVTVVFTPENDDPNSGFNTSLNILTETGEMNVPVECKPKAPIPRLDVEQLDFGGVVLGESRTRTLYLRNDGGLSTRAIFQLRIDANENIFNVETDEDGVLLKPYSNVSINVTCVPVDEGKRQAHLAVSFAGVKDVSVRLIAKGLPLPLSIDKHEIDFQCCTVGQTYREAVQVTNCCNIAQKCTLTRSKKAKGHTSSYPDILYCQAHASATFEILFSPTCSTLEQYGSDVRFAFRITSPGQTVPLEFTIKANVSTSEVKVDPDAVDFGKCPLGELTPLAVHLSTTSIAPLDYGVVDLPNELSIADSKQTGTLVPNRPTELVLQYNPQQEGMHEHKLHFRTLEGTATALKVSAEGVTAPLSLQPNSINFRATPIGKCSKGTVVLKNQSSEEQRFFVNVPSGCSFAIDPAAGRLSPSASQALLVQFGPTSDVFPAERCQPGSEHADTPSVFGPDENSSSANSRTGHGTPGVEQHGDIAIQGPENVTHEVSRGRLWQVESIPVLALDAPSMPPIHLQLAGACKDPAFSVVLINGQSPQQTPKLHFGTVAALSKTVGYIRLRNNQHEPLTPALSEMDFAGAFWLDKAVRQISPGRTADIHVAFCPAEEAAYYDCLEIHAANESQSIRLRGRGKKPELQVQPESKELQFEDCVIGKSLKKSFIIKNSGPFTITLTFKTVNTGLHVNSDGQCPFYCTLSKARIQPGVSHETGVVFMPDWEPEDFLSTPFSAEVRVVVPGQSEIVPIAVSGRAQSQLSIVHGGDPVDTAERHKHELIHPQEGLLILNLPGPLNPGQSTSKTVRIGSIKAGESTSARSNSKGNGSQATEFEVSDFDALAKAIGWAVEPSKGNVAAGDEKALQVALTVPETPPIGSPPRMGLSTTATADTLIHFKHGDTSSREYVRLRARCGINAYFPDAIVSENQTDK